MQKYRKACVIMLCIALVLALCGCESQNVRNAKACVDEVFELTMNKAELEVELEKCKAGTSAAELARAASLEGQIDACDMLIDRSTAELRKLYGQLSVEEQQEMKSYANEVFQNTLTGIGN